MKYAFLIFILLLATPAFAQSELAELTLGKQTYAPQETVQLRIKYNIEPVFPLTAQDIVLFDERGGKIPLAQAVLKISKTEFYDYFDLPNTLKNQSYKISTKELKYRTPSGTTLPIPSQEISFNVEDRDAVLSLQPGIFFAELNDLDQPGFQLRVSNRGNKDIDVQLSSDADFIMVPSESITIKADDFMTRPITTKVVGKVDSSFSGNVLITYDGEQSSVPVLLVRRGAVLEEETLIEFVPGGVKVVDEADLSDALKFVLTITEVDREMEMNESQIGQFPLKNDADTTLNNIQISLTGNLAGAVSVDQSSIEKLLPGETVNLEVTLNPNRDLSEAHQGELVVSTEEGATLSFPIKLGPRSAEVKIPEPIIEDEGVTPIDFSEEEPKSRTGVTVIIIVIILLLIGGGVYILLKQKKKGPRGRQFPFRP